MATSRIPSMRAPREAQMLRRKVRVWLAPGSWIRSAKSKFRVTLIEAGLFTLVVLTALVIASVSLWWVPVYLVFLGVIFITPRSWQLPPSSSNADSESNAVGIANLSSSLRVDRAGADEFGSSGQFDSDLGNFEPPESVSSDFDVKATGSAKRRVRVRARKVAKSAVEQAIAAIPAAWIQVGPGKFVRVEHGIQAVDSLLIDELTAPTCSATETHSTPEQSAFTYRLMSAEQESFASSGASPDEFEPIPVSHDRISGSVSEEYGIAPSVFRLTSEHGSSTRTPDHDPSGQVEHPKAEIVISAKPAGQDSTAQAPPTCFLWQAAALRSWTRRIQRGMIDATLCGRRVSSNRAIRRCPNPRISVGTSAMMNVVRHDAARRAFGRIYHVQRIVRTRSPPLH